LRSIEDSLSPSLKILMEKVSTILRRFFEFTMPQEGFEKEFEMVL
tara:strand:+ start:2865 stop:2999 length:135 start_codon:yes stop_codon:yes gene_type:complete